MTLTDRQTASLTALLDSYVELLGRELAEVAEARLLPVPEKWERLERIRVSYDGLLREVARAIHAVVSEC